MIVTVGGVSVRLTFIDGQTGKSAGGIDPGSLGRISPFISRGNRSSIDLSVTRVEGPTWGEILTPEDFARIGRVARAAEGRFPFTKVPHETAVTRKRPTRPGNISMPLLTARDANNVSVFPHPGFLVAVDHRRGRAQALVRVPEDGDEGSSLTPVLQAVLGLAAPDHGALMLHAASLMLSGGGYLFAGSSGSGKSTVAGSADTGAVLSDDGSWCEYTGGCFALFPTPFSQANPPPRPPDPAPLARVLFLKQGGDDRIVDLSPGRAMTMLLFNHIHFFRFMGRRAARKAFALAGDICAGHPASTLVFTRDFNPVPFFRGISNESKKAV